ncbi:MAG: MBL fold metallo-hydrolase [Myxococcales bacterium]|nr:MBL fold metallo-hydrolase [Myxococcales bacterium]
MSQPSTQKQEQQTASEEVVEVAPGVLRMQLPIEMPGLGHVNMYCLLDDEGAAVVDPGLPGEANWEAVVQRLGQADLEVRHVHTVLITHSHPDHFGGAGRFRAETDCRVIAHEKFSLLSGAGQRPHLEVSVEHLHDHGHDHAHGQDESHGAPGPRPVPDTTDDDIPWMRDLGQRPPTPWGGRPPAPTPEQMERWEKMRAAGASTFMPRLTHVVGAGSRLRLAGRDWFVLHTPGHTEDHFCLHDPDEGIFLAGDHVLPSITPHISGLGEIEDPLQAFYDSLEEVAEIPDVRRCLPAHGHPFDDLPLRARAIRQHHDERLEKIKGISKRLGPATVEDISKQLFQERNWGSMAESETYAHLEHLRLRGQAEHHRREDGWLIYETDAPAAGF